MSTDTETDAAVGPRLRSAGIVWGIALGALGAGGLWLTAGPSRTAEIATWVGEIEPGTAVGLGILIAGGLLLLTGLAGLLRRAQRGVAMRRAASPTVTGEPTAAAHVAAADDPFTVDAETPDPA